MIEITELKVFKHIGFVAVSIAFLVIFFISVFQHNFLGMVLSLMVIFCCYWWAYWEIKYSELKSGGNPK